MFKRHIAIRLPTEMLIELCQFKRSEMKNILLTTTLLISNIISFSQEAKVITDKEKYKFEEIIEVTFELNAEYDSTNLPDFKGLKLIGGPTKKSSVSVQSGEKTISTSRTYKLRPVKSGRLKINTLIYFIDGKRIKGKPTKIEVTPSILTDEELKEKEFQDFIKDKIKPKGTTRIILHENKGYIEIFGDIEWKFHRRLTAEEIEQIKKIE